jgi:hypothetical protein
MTDNLDTYATVFPMRNMKHVFAAKFKIYVDSPVFGMFTQCLTSIRDSVCSFAIFPFI